MKLSDWQKCPVIGCGNRKCFRLNSVFCYPHTVIAKNIISKYFNKIRIQMFKELSNGAK